METPPVSDSLPRIGVREFRGNFTDFMRRAQAGQSFLVTSHDRVVAVIRPPPADQPAPWRPGALRGKIHLTDDFDVLPPDVLAAMHGDG